MQKVFAAPAAAGAEGIVVPDPVDWTEYAQTYDMLLAHNPAYQALIDAFNAFLDTAALPEDARVLDAGAGTGNFAHALYAVLPEADLTLLEPDAGMRARAAEKLAGASARMAPCGLQAYSGSAGFDLIICTHALYAMPDPTARLAQMRALVKPGGWLFLIDMGRVLRLWDWQLYLLRHLIGRAGLLRAIAIMRQGRPIAVANRAVRRAQKSGHYWTYQTHQLGAALAEAGWHVETLRPIYRGYSDLAIARAEG